MKKWLIILACMLVCFTLFTGCTGDSGKDNSGSDLGNAVEIDIDTEGTDDTETSIGDGNIVYDFKDPENSDGIVVDIKD